MISRLWKSKLVRYSVWFVVTTITLYALLCAWLNATGSRRWAEVKVILEKNGETLDFAKIQSQQADESRNYCSIEPLKGINLPGDEKSPEGLKRKALQDLEWRANDSKISPPELSSGVAFGQAPDMKAWAEYAQAVKYVPEAKEKLGDIAAFCAALDAAHPLLRTLSNEARAHDQALFRPLPKPASPLFTMSVPHYNSVMVAGRALMLRALAYAEAGQGAEAISSTIALLRLVSATQKEPLLISNLVSSAMNELAIEAVWSVLRHRNLADADLSDLQTAMAKLDFGHSYLQAMRGEMAAGADAVEFLQRERSKAAWMLGLQAPNLPNPPPSGVAETLAWAVVPSGLFDLNKANLVEIEWKHMIQPLAHGTLADLVKTSDEMDKEVQAHRGIWFPGHYFASLIVPAISRVGDKALRTETLRRQAIIACALERHFIATKSYPATLADLAPGLLPAIPSDPMDQKPMRYHPTSDSRYMVWSVGPDLKDDGGVVKPDTNPNHKVGARALTKREYKGDWTWKYEPVK